MTSNLPATEDTARFSPARLPWHPAIEEKFGALGVDKSSWKALTEAVFPGAKSADSIVMALSYCAARKLDPFKRPVHIVPMWDSNRRQMVETVWPGISEIRTTAFRTSQYAGCDEVEFGEWVSKTITGKVGKRGEEREVTVSMTFPEWGRMTVYRMLNGQRCKFVSPKVYWLEAYGRMGSSDVPNDMWQKRPAGQLEKCVEAAALRKAFPEEIGNDYTAEEMHGQILAGDTQTASVEMIAGPAAPEPPAPPAKPGKAKAAATPKPAKEEKIEDAEIVESTKPVEPAPAEQEEPFRYGEWLAYVSESFATCQTEADVDETHEGFRDDVETRLSRNQAGEYAEIHEAALTRVTDAARSTEPEAEEEAPAAPPPPAATKPASAPSLDDDEEAEPTPAEAFHARVAEYLARPDLTKELINDLVKSTNTERKAMKAAGEFSDADKDRLKAAVDAAWARLDEAENAVDGQEDEEEQQQEEPQAGSTDLDQRVEAFTKEFMTKMDAASSMTEMNAYFASTLTTRNGFGLDTADPRVKAWKQKKVDRTAALNG